MADHSAIQAAIAVLTRLGYAVNISRNQTCCGALYRHNGLPEKAQQLCDQNRKITQTSRAQALITIATACQLELLEQQASHIPVISITNFVLQHLQLMQRQADLKSISGRVLLHMPCTARKEPVDQLLGLIPGLTLELFPDNGICCGAAGSYLLTQPKLATQLGEDKLEHLKAAAPSILVTSNTGCAIQFRRLLKREKLPIEVLHPIELINRQLS